MKNRFHFTRRIWAATVVVVIFAGARSGAQTNSEATNEPLKLLPPLDELPPTFWEQHANPISFAGIGLAVLVAVSLWLFFRSKPKMIIPPEVEMRAALQELCAQPEDGAVLSRVSQITRRYFITAFQLAAGELTTAELNRELARCENIDPELAKAAYEFLRECDSGKFSAEAKSEKINAAARALNLIEQAESRRAPLRQPAESPTPEPRP